MTKRQIIATTLSISGQGELKHFQVKIPFSAALIIGVETGVRAKAIIENPRPPVKRAMERKEMENPFSNEILVGELKLQSCEKANIFYAKEIKVLNEDAGFKIGSFRENSWTHGMKKELDEVAVDGNTTIISGIYRDRVGEQMKKDIQYEVNVYLWYEGSQEPGVRSLENKNKQQQ